MHFLRMLQILKSFLENIGEGRLVLEKKKNNLTLIALAVEKKKKATVITMKATGIH